MRMIPPVIDIHAPYGEKEIFQLLKTTKIKNFDNCIVFHSLNYPQSTKKNQKKSAKTKLFSDHLNNTNTLSY